VRDSGGAIWSPNFQDVDAASLAAARDAKIKVVVWTVNEPADIQRVLEMKVDGIISDYPDRVRGEMKAWRP
jgi:glycerophosphoryl diester phosphodiesterase